MTYSRQASSSSLVPLLQLINEDKYEEKNIDEFKSDREVPFDGDLDVDDERGYDTFLL